MQRFETDSLFGILILAAGKGERFRESGGNGEKLLAKYSDEAGHERPLIALTLLNAQKTGLPVMLVCRPESLEVQKIAAKYGIDFTTIASNGSGETIAAGVRATAEWHGWLIVPGDMGWITPDDYSLIVSELRRGAEQVRLVCGQQPGHPVGFSSENRSRLMNLTGDHGAKKLIDPSRLISIQSSGRVIQDADYYHPD